MIFYVQVMERESILTISEYSDIEEHGDIHTYQIANNKLKYPEDYEAVSQLNNYDILDYIL